MSLSSKRRRQPIVPATRDEWWLFIHGAGDVLQSSDGTEYADGLWWQHEGGAHVLRFSMSTAEVAGVLRMSVRAARRALHELRLAGFVERVAAERAYMLMFSGDITAPGKCELEEWAEFSEEATVWISHWLDNGWPEPTTDEERRFRQKFEELCPGIEPAPAEAVEAEA